MLQFLYRAIVHALCCVCCLYVCVWQLNVPKEADASHTVNFRNLLLNKCQQEFEKDKVEELDIAEKQKLIDEATSVSDLAILPAYLVNEDNDLHLFLCST